MPARDEPDLDPVLADAVRRTYVRPVDEGTASRHVSAIVAAATAADPSARHPRRGRRAWRPALGVGAAVTLLLPVGLAAAGVSLPAAVEKPYSAVGIELPNQAAVAPRPTVTTTAPAITSTGAARPASAAAAPGRSKAAPGRGTSGASGRPAPSRRPATPPPARGSANPNGRGETSAAKPKPTTPRRPVVTPKKPMARPNNRRPVTPAKPHARPDTSPRQDPATPPTGRAQPSGSPK